MNQVASAVSLISGRMRLRASVNTLVPFLLAGCCCAVCMLLAWKIRSAGGYSSPTAAAFCLFAFAAAGTFLGLFRPISPTKAAEEIDKACGLADRLVTAVEIARRGEDDKLRDLAPLVLADAEQAVSNCDLSRVARLHLPRLTRFLVLPAAVAVVIAAAPEEDLRGVFGARRGGGSRGSGSATAGKDGGAVELPAGPDSLESGTLEEQAGETERQPIVMVPTAGGEGETEGAEEAAVASADTPEFAEGQAPEGSKTGGEEGSVAEGSSGGAASAAAGPGEPSTAGSTEARPARASPHEYSLYEKQYPEYREIIARYFARDAEHEE